MKKIITFIAVAVLALAAQAQSVDPPVISWTAEDGMLTITASGDGFILMEVEIVGDDIYARTGQDEATLYRPYDEEEGVTAYVRACVAVAGDPVSEYAEETIIVPPVGDTPTPPEITWTAENGTLLITATGDGFIMMEVDVAPDVTIERTGEDEAYYYMQYDPEEGVTVTVRACIWANAEPVSDYTEETIVVPPVGDTPPAAPEITWTAIDGQLTITATGNGHVWMEIELAPDVIISRHDDDEVVYYMQYDPEEGVTVYVRAYIWEDGAPVSDYTEKTIVVPPTIPDDPHMLGHWLVIRDMFGNDNWFELQQGANGDYVTSVSLEYYVYGLYDPDSEADVPFYFMIDGMHYGPSGEMDDATLGQAMENPLYESEGYYTVPVGYAYSLGIAIIEGQMYVYASQAYPTSVNELNEGKEIASKRYFNMAGQEMPQADGMTIVVTTYTDGTTSAAKVMK